MNAAPGLQHHEIGCFLGHQQNINYCTYLKMLGFEGIHLENALEGYSKHSKC